MGSKSWIWKLLILAAVTLLLSLVLARIGWLVDERQQRQEEAVASVMQSQAGAQTLLGPLLLRQCTETWTATVGEGKELRQELQSSKFTFSVAPASLVVSGALNQEPRYRGLFKVNGYAGRLQFDAKWAPLEGMQPGPDRAGGKVQCEAPRVMLSASDSRGLRMATLKAGEQALDIRPSTGHPGYERGFHAELPAQAVNGPLQLQLNLELDGTQSFALVPAAAATRMSLRSDWPHPSFGGRFLPAPDTRQINEDGFSAQWQVSELASSAAADAVAGKPISEIDTLQFSMIDPVNPYVMSDRAIKYGLLFIVLTFVCVGLVELLAGRRVHPVQYGLVGLALALFFLLLLSLSEHLGFAPSYAIASAAAALLLGYYAAAMLGGWARGLGFGAGVAGLYGALYVLLSREQTALLIGALMLFTVLAVVMVLTRRLDWYALGGRLSASQG